ncbi:hypothetical protein ACVWYF_004013 [Hymenobacter sp. UYAg731]
MSPENFGAIVSNASKITAFDEFCFFNNIKFLNA